ncbi:LysR family transcriptional regulator [Halomonas sp. 707D4]|uniref:LysR family transcriptional regulator n=2 Tax=unclassified Halomonas TaxID=2609666 RepID=UPI00209F1DD4|nr:LysR family transcriptional regulator [Halomonas sp. 707D4]MCP1327558.1 LysR family transcriptional regulator [Halomonas sp. 707D4]
MQELNLRYFHSVAKTGSLSAAAQELHVAVSAVSRQITNLEQRLGLALFVRQPRGMALTEAGERLLAYALRNELELAGVIDEMRGIQKRQQKTLRIACPDGMAWHFLPRIIARFAAGHPDVDFEMKVVDSAQASALVKQGEVDIALTFSLSVDIGIRVVSSHGAAIGALMASSHPLAQKSTLSVKDLADYPLALADTGSTVRYLFDVACRLAGIRLCARVAGNTLGVIYTLVCEHASMVGLCSAISVSGKVESAGLVHKPLTDPPLAQRSLQVQVMAERQLPGHIDAFMAYLDGQLPAAGPGPTAS